MQKGSVLTSILTYINSTIDYNQGELQVNNSMYLSSTNFSNKKITVSASISRNLTGPLVDTLNFWGARLGISQKGGKKVNFSVNSFYDGFDAGAVRHRSTLQARFSILPQLEAMFNIEYGSVKHLYGLEHKNIFGSKLLIKYNL